MCVASVVWLCHMQAGKKGGAWGEEKGGKGDRGVTKKGFPFDVEARNTQRKKKKGT